MINELEFNSCILRNWLMELKRNTHSCNSTDILKQWFTFLQIFLHFMQQIIFNFTSFITNGALNSSILKQPWSITNCMVRSDLNSTLLSVAWLKFIPNCGTVENTRMKSRTTLGMVLGKSENILGKRNMLVIRIICIFPKYFPKASCLEVDWKVKDYSIIPLFH